MAKGSNPADAHRKAMKAKEKKKNAASRKSTRQDNEARVPVPELEATIRALSAKQRENNDVLPAAEKAELDKAVKDWERVKKIKEEYVKAHPEEEAKIMATIAKDPTAPLPPPRQPRNAGPQRSAAEIEKRRKDAERSRSRMQRGLRFDRKGRLLNPEMSVYYDKVFNPYGAPPPGLPHRARPLTPQEIAILDAEEAESEESDASLPDDIIMPLGPPPPKAQTQAIEEESGEEESSDEEDVPLPQGLPPLPQGPPPLPSGPPPAFQQFGNNQPSSFPQPPNHSGVPSLLPPPPPPPGHRGFFHASPATSMSGASPPPPTRLLNHLPQRDPRAPLPAPPTPHVIRSPASPLPPPPAGLPAKPGQLPPKPPVDEKTLAEARAKATISAAPVVRDLKKEATAFLPGALKRKRPANVQGSQKKVASGPSAPPAPVHTGGIQLPPGFGAATGVALPPGFGRSGTEDAPGTQQDAQEMEIAPDQVQGMPLPPGVSRKAYVQEDEGDEGEEIQDVALPPGFYSQSGDAGGTSLPGYDDEEDHGGEQGVALPPRPDEDGASYYLPGMDDDDDDGGVQSVALPPRPGDDGASYYLPGMSDDEEGGGEGDLQAVALPPGFGESGGYTGPTVENDVNDAGEDAEVQGVRLPPGLSG